MSEGTFRILGTITPEDARLLMNSDPSLQRRVEFVEKKPIPVGTILMLQKTGRGVKGVLIPRDEVLRRILKFQTRWMQPVQD